ncbi:coiled-coil domain-containing protein 81-like isoform X2 [Chroicocephalus ridibundus]|uniref:coiled-coil domain-containing protein 81-like isoform X2 n=1 Tax=Chroicocephalus ridibundus TaxID=1192867 RepID=UPI002FDECF82
MEGCCTVAVSLELSSLFPSLLCLSTKEVVTIWDAVSAYILGQLKLDKGVLLPGLGTFTMVQERFQGEEEVFMARRPVFQLNMDKACLQELTFPTGVIPGEKPEATCHFPTPCLGAEDVEIKPLNYR